MKFKSFLSVVVAVVIVIQTTFTTIAVGDSSTEDTGGNQVNPEIVKINCADDAGDYTYFNSDYCYTSSTESEAMGKYYNFTSITGLVDNDSNKITCNRLKYKNENREDYIYLDKISPSENMELQITLNRGSFTHNTERTYNYFTIRGNFKTYKEGLEAKMFTLDFGTNNELCPAYISENGDLKDSAGNLKDAAGINYGKIPYNQWFNYCMAVNLVESTVDVYLNNSKVISDIPLGIYDKKLSKVKFELIKGVGNYYVDDFEVTGLEKPYENGKETMTDVFPDNDEKIKDFLNGKVAFHAYGKLMYRNGQKTKINSDSIYDENECELYVDYEALNCAFDLGLAPVNIATPQPSVIPQPSATPDDSPLNLSGINITISSDGNIEYNGTNYTLSKKPKKCNKVMYIPIKNFSEEVLKKHVFSHKTGFFIISDKKEELDTSTWQFGSFRNSSSLITQWDDIDYLNSYLTYERPDVNTIKNDFEATGSLNQHPRLFINKDRFSMLRSEYEKTDNRNETFIGYVNKIIIKADALCEPKKSESEQNVTSESEQNVTSEGDEKEIIYENPPCKYTWDDSIRMLSTAREMYKRFIYLGFAYQMTGNNKYVERAYAELYSADSFPDFNTAHIIDAGEFAAGFAIAYDWLYDGYSDDQMELVKRVCFEKSLKPLASGLYGRLTSSFTQWSQWASFRWMSNFNTIINAGVMSSAIATYECDEDYCANVIASSLRSVEYTLMGFMPGGGWNESFSYWDYTVGYLTNIMSSLDSAFATTYGLENSMGVAKTLDFALASIGTCGLNNFHDCPYLTKYSTENFIYLAQKYKNKVAVETRKKTLSNLTSELNIQDILFFDFKSDEKWNSVDTCIKINGTELYSIRDTYDMDKSNFYFSTHFGTTSGYHQHNDCGTFVLDMMGVRFAEDLGSDNYNLQNEQKYKDFEIYRKRAEGHNVMVINPQNHKAEFEQNTNLFKPITKYGSNQYEGYVVSDLEGVYDDTSAMKMGYYIDSNKSAVTMRNEFTLSKESDVYWYMHTKADVFIKDKVAYLTRDGKTVCVKFNTNEEIQQSAEIYSMDALAYDFSRHPPDQNNNDGYKKIVIKMRASGSNKLTVRIAPFGDNEEILTTDIEHWSLPEDKGIKTDTLYECTDASTLGTYYRGEVSNEYGVGATGVDNANVKFITNKLEGSSYNGFSQYTWGSVDNYGNWSEAEDKGYLIIDADIYPVSAKASFVTTQNVTLSGTLDLNTNSWNKVRVIYDRSTKMAKTAVNGKMGDWHISGLGNKTVDNVVRNHIRLLVTGDSEDGYLYVDNYKIYKSNKIPNYADSIIHGCEIENNVLKVSEGTTVADIGATGTACTVYEDDSLRYTLNDSVVLRNGNVVVFKGDYTYLKYHINVEYELKPPDPEGGILEGEKFMYFNDFSNVYVAKGNKTYPSQGLGGKTAEIDKYLCLKGNSKIQNDMFIQYQIPDFQPDDIYTWTMSFYPGKGCKSLKFATEQHTSLSKYIDCKDFSPDQWNTLTFVIDNKNSKSYIYINNILKSEYSGPVIKNGIVRMVVYSYNDYSNGTTCWIDNIGLFKGNCSYQRAISSHDYNVSGTVISGYGEDTVSQFKEKITFLYDNYGVEVCNEDGTDANNDDVMSKKKMVFVTVNNYKVQQYLLGDPKVSILKDQGFRYIEHSSSVVMGKAVDTDSLNGLGGKPAVIDKYLCLTGNSTSSNDMFIQYEVPESLQNGIYTWTMSFYPGKDCKFIKFATVGHKSLSNSIDCKVFSPHVWNTLTLVIDFNNSISYVYVNDNLVSEYTKAIIDGKTLRLVVYSSRDNCFGTTCWLDNVGLYKGSFSYKDTISSDYYKISGIFISGYGEDTVSQFKEKIKLPNENYGIEVYNKDGDTQGDKADNNDKMSNNKMVFLTIKGHKVQQYLLRIDQ